MNKSCIWLIGSGPMAEAYWNVLKNFDSEYVVIGRSEASALGFESRTGQKVIVGGLSQFIESSVKVADMAIVATGIEQLDSVAGELIDRGVKRILLEKPGAISSTKLKEVAALAKQRGVEVYIAYNRRQFSSVLEAKKIIEADGGVRSFGFEISEWSHLIAGLDTSEAVLNNWFTSNTSHVVDLAFHLGGKPRELSTYSSGGLNWHMRSSVFCGSGVSESGALFSYLGDWEAPGRWSLDILTSKSRLIFRPMEILQIQSIGSVEVKQYIIDDSLDKEFKPGLFRQVKNFLSKDDEELCGISEQVAMFDVYNKMAGYG